MERKLQELILCILLAFVSVSAHAQDFIVTGTVKEADTGDPIPGANVVVKGTSNGTVTDLEGKYTLKIENQTIVLTYSFVGFITQEIEVGSQSVIDVELVSDVTSLSEVVVIGYGTQKKKVVTGAIVSVSSDQISATPVLRAEQALQGRTAGVFVANQSGQPGETPTVIIRGAGTTGNSTPLYIVDGLAVDNIEYLNPGDIESMDVLKDAASAAIYGARAANGVVLITTKSGEKGKLTVTYDGYYGIQNASNTIEMLKADDYKMIMNEGARNANLTEPFDLNQISTVDTDWQEELFQKNAPIFNHQISVAGGNDKSTFSSSLSYFSQEGIIGGSKSQFDRYTARINSVHKVNKVFTFGNNLAFSSVIRRGIDSNTSFNGAFSSAVNIDPLTPVFETDPTILDNPPYSNEPVVTDDDGNVYGISNYVGAEIVNPLAQIELANQESKKDELVGNVYGEFEFIDGLKFKTDLGINIANGMNDSFRPLFYLNGAQNNTIKTSVSKDMYRVTAWQWENTLTYSKRIDDHNFSALGGITARKSRYEDLSGFNAKVPTIDPDNVYLNLAKDTVWEAYGGAVESSLYSLFGRVTYDYKDKYSVTGILRRDGSSKFGSAKKYGIFPSVGVAWVASDEVFLQNLGPLELIKFRASWGINGNQEIGDYQFATTLSNGRWYTSAIGPLLGTSPEYLSNPDIAWEESEQLDIALDLAFFDDRLTATVDYYRKETKGLLERIPVPGHVGVGPPIANVGSVANTGFEFMANWRENKGDFSYSIGLNGAINNNEITEIGSPIEGASWAIAGPITRAELGQPIAYFYGYKTDGIFQTQEDVFAYINNQGKRLQPKAKPGDVRFVDVNGDGIISPEDRTKIGNPTPTWTLGLNGSAKYKGFDLSFLVTGALGHNIFNGMNRVDLRYTNRPTSFLGRWTGPGTSDRLPRYSWSDTNNNYRVSDLYIEDGSYVRIRNLQVGYSLPKELLDKIGGSSWRFYVSAENLLTFTGYSGADPEIGNGVDADGNKSSFDIGIDRAVYPQPRTFRFGTSFTF
jgi:TonB-linked SusC/RagA family outer membrane protein